MRLQMLWSAIDWHNVPPHLSAQAPHIPEKTL